MTGAFAPGQFSPNLLLAPVSSTSPLINGQWRVELRRSSNDEPATGAYDLSDVGASGPRVHLGRLDPFSGGLDLDGRLRALEGVLTVTELPDPNAFATSAGALTLAKFVDPFFSGGPCLRLVQETAWDTAP